MKKLFMFFLTVLCLMSWGQGGVSDVVPNTEWVVPYGNTATFTFNAVANALDANQNMYVVGYTTGGGGTGRNLVIMKRNSFGNLVGSIYIYDNGGDDEGFDITFDPISGDIYATGYSWDATSGEDIIVIRLNASMVQQYVARWDGGANGDDRAVDIAIDPSGYAYVTGTSYSGSSKDLTTIKFKPTGALQWVNTWDNSGQDETGVSLVLSSNFNTVFVAGNTITGGFTDIVGRSIDATSGTGNWNSIINGMANLNDYCKGLILSGANIVLCGMVDNGAPTNEDFTTVKLDGSTGATIFKSDYDYLNNNEVATGLARDSIGNIGVIGLAPNGNVEYHMVCYDSTGTLIWVNKRNTGSNASIVEPKVANDTIAHHWYACGNALRSTYDMFVYQVTPGGNLGWEHFIDGDGAGYDAAKNLVVNGLGEVYIAGVTTSTANTYQLTSVKISQTPVYFPPDLQAGEEPTVGHLFLENKGQIMYAGGSAPAEEVKFSCTDIYPHEYFGVTKFSYKYYYRDIFGGNDTTQRIDVIHYNGNSLTKVYPFKPKHGQLSYMQEGLLDAVTGVQGYERMMVPNIYPYIDLHYYSNDDGLKLYYVLKPFADPNNIQWDIQGATTTSISGNALHIVGHNNLKAFDGPTLYTVDNTGAPQTVTATATWTNVAGKYKFAISGTYNVAWPLIIEVSYGNNIPTPPGPGDNVYHSTYYGGVSNEWAKVMDIDKSNGNYVVVMQTKEMVPLGGDPGFPVISGSLVSVSTNTNTNGTLLGIVLFDKDGHRLAANTYGYNGFDMKPAGVALQGDLITVVGNADVPHPSLSYPARKDLPLYNSVAPLTPGTYTSIQGHGYVIQFKYTPISPNVGSINNILWATRLNGFAADIAKTPDRNSLYIVTATDLGIAADTKTLSGAYNNGSFSHSWEHWKVSQFDSLGVRKWAAIIPSCNKSLINNNIFNNLNLGQVYYDAYRKCKIACDDYGFAIAGEVDSTYLLTTSAFGAPTYTAFSGRTDAFYARFNKKNSLKYCSYLGNPGDEGFLDITSCGNGEFIAAGYCNSRNMQKICTAPMGGQFSDTTTTASDAKILITKFDSTGTRLYSTYYGIDNAGTNIYGMSVASTNAGKLFLTGRTYNGGSFPLVASNPPGTYSKGTIDATEAFMLSFDGTNNPIWNTYWGGNKEDVGMASGYNPITDKLILVGYTNTHSVPNGFHGTPYFYVQQGPDASAWYQGKINSVNPAQVLTQTSDAYITHFSAAEVVGIKEYFTDKRNTETFEIFPNPTQQETNIAFKNAIKGLVNIEVYNQVGQLIMYEKKQGISAYTTVPLNISTLKAGMYIVTVRSTEGPISKKLIVTR